MSSRSRRLFFGLICLAVTLAVTVRGCGTSAPTVAGTVTVGGLPLQEGAITFFPIDGTAGGTSGARITEGKFDVARGLAVGKYRIAIEGTRPDPFLTEKAPFSDELIPKPVQVVAKVYRGQNSPLIETVNRGHQVYSFNLPKISVNMGIR